MGSDETERTASIAVDELVEVVERLDDEEVDAATLEQLGLLGEASRARRRRPRGRRRAARSSPR